MSKNRSPSQPLNAQRPRALGARLFRAHLPAVPGWLGPPVNVLMAGTARALNAVGDMLVPPVCVGCQEPLTTHRTLCPSCWFGIDFITAPRCEILGIPLPFDAGEGAISAAALAHPPAFDRARSVAHHTGVMRHLIYGLKYADRTEALKLFRHWMLAAGDDLLAEADLIIPVPLHRWRLWRRRFNQSALLGAELARATGLPHAPLALGRPRRTRSQVGLTRNQRERNVAGAFRVPPRARQMIEGRRVLLIDDVMTTGATADACARTLRRAGAANVDVLTLARVVDPLQPSA